MTAMRRERRQRDYRPHIQLVPFPLWRRNMRALTTPGEWRELRLALLDRQGITCVICGKEETLPRRVYAHEEWRYDETTEPATARITGVSLVCWHCHACEHWGCTNSLVGRGDLTSRAVDDTIAHFCRLNGATERDFTAHQKEARRDWIRRCQRKWRIDYGIFAEWTVKTFERDPLNHEDWPSIILETWIDGQRPTMKEIVAAVCATGVQQGMTLDVQA